MPVIKRSFLPPYRSPIADALGYLNTAWEYFFRDLFKRIYPLGSEEQFTLVNNQSSAADVTGLKFSPRGVTCVFFEYFIQRITNSSELSEAGLILFTYNPTSEDWSSSVVTQNNPDDAGVAFSITEAGQVQYTTTNQSGASLISSLYYRARTLAGKNSLYSASGAN